MKSVKMKRNREFSYGVFEGEKTYPLPDAVADQLIADGHATLVAVITDAPSPAAEAIPAEESDNVEVTPAEAAPVADGNADGKTRPLMTAKRSSPK